MKREKIIELLQKVKYPGYDRDIVSFGMVKDVQTDGKHIVVDLVIKTNDQEKKQQIVQEVQKVLVSGEPAVTVDVRLQETGGGAPTSETTRLSDPAEGQKRIEGIKQIIAVASGKGGVGKSTVAANLAVALVKKGYRVGLLDLDIYGPSIPILFGLEGIQPAVDGNRIKPLERYGVRLISFGMFYTERKPVIWRGPLVAKMVKQLLDDVDWGELDYLVLDLPPGTGDVQLTLVQSILLSGAVIVTSPQDLALIDAEKGAEMFRHVEVPVLGIVENYSYFICPHCGEKSDIFRGALPEEKDSILGAPILGRIPVEAEISSLSDKGIPIVASNNASQASKTFLEIGDKIITLLNK